MIVKQPHSLFNLNILVLSTDVVIRSDSDFRYLVRAIPCGCPHPTILGQPQGIARTGTKSHFYQVSSIDPIIYFTSLIGIIIFKKIIRYANI